MLFREQLGARAELSLQARTRPRLSRHAVKCLLNKDGPQVPPGPPATLSTIKEIFMKFFHQFYFRLLQYAAELTRVLIMNS